MTSSKPVSAFSLLLCLQSCRQSNTQRHCHFEIALSRVSLLAFLAALSESPRYAWPAVAAYARKFFRSSRTEAVWRHLG